MNKYLLETLWNWLFILPHPGLMLYTQCKSTAFGLYCTRINNSHNNMVITLLSARNQAPFRVHSTYTWLSLPSVTIKLSWLLCKLPHKYFKSWHHHSVRKTHCAKHPLVEEFIPRATGNLPTYKTSLYYAVTAYLPGHLPGRTIETVCSSVFLVWGNISRIRDRTACFSRLAILRQCL